MKVVQGEIQRIDTALREERERAKQVIGALEITLDEVRGHVVEIDRTRRSLTSLCETLVSEVVTYRNGYEIESQTLNPQTLSQTVSP